MVKLFVGNLPEGVDADRLRAMFGKFVRIQECDVLKNYAFVHVNTEKDADVAIEKFNKHTLSGKEIHVERSTSHLRKQPGMGDKCFTCGAEEHKTSQCPRNPNRRKREMDTSYEESVPKKPKPMVLENNSLPIQPPAKTQCWGYKVEGEGRGSESDPELPCPQNPELRTLYEQYLDSRTRYFFYREQLNKELRLNNSAPPAATSTSIPAVNLPPSYPAAPPVLQQPSPLPDPNPSIIRVDLTQHIRTQGQVGPIITRTPIVPEKGGYFASATATSTIATNNTFPPPNYSASFSSNPQLPHAYSSSSSPAFKPIPTHSGIAPRPPMHYNTVAPPHPRQPIPTGQPTPLSAIRTRISPGYATRR